MASQPEFPTDSSWVLNHGTQIHSPIPHTHGGAVAAAVDTLPEPYQTILRQHYYQRMTFQEIADAWGWRSRQLAWWHTQQGLRLLAVALREKGIDYETD